jgi:hypothetical protein
LKWTDYCEQPAEMPRSKKTASELEQMILAQVRDEMVCPTDLQVRVIRVAGRWDAAAEVIDKAKHPDCLARAANRLGASLPVRSRFRGNEPAAPGLSRGSVA